MSVDKTLAAVADVLARAQRILFVTGAGISVDSGLPTYRGIWMLTDSRLLTARLTRIVPHVIDTALLVLGIWLAWSARFNPLNEPWLMAKIVLLLVYVGLGSVALRPDRSKAVRTAAYVISLAVVVSIIIIAKTKPAWPLA